MSGLERRASVIGTINLERQIGTALQKNQPPYDVLHFPPTPHPPLLETPTVRLREQLIEAMGLRYDPLITSVSESDPASSFGEVYVDPQPSLLDTLRRESSTLIFARYGMGKTATRRALEYALRNSDEDHPALCVTYRPKISSVLTEPAHQLLKRHLAAIAAETSIDLLIQLIERLDDGVWRFSDQASVRPLEQPDSRAWRFTRRHAAALRRQAQALPILLRKNIIEAAETSDHADGIIWRGWRAVARHVAVTPQWKALIKQLASTIGIGQSRSLTWDQTLQDVQTLGFPRVFLLIDAVDERDVERDALYALIKPLLAALDRFQARQVFLKCFLPADLKALFSEHTMRIQGLTLLPEIANITEASPQHLQAIITERLQTACRSNIGFRSLDWLKGDDIEGGIQAHLASIAQGSPRRMIELASELLDFHSLHGFQEHGRLWLNVREWEIFLARLEHTSLASP